ncbi:MAG: CPBP family glutamic-type intramembrane protease [Verrucomicrobiota bacterium]
MRRLPSAKSWAISLALTATLASLAFLLLPGFSDLNQIPSLKQMVKIAAVAFVFPAFCEEFVFRGLLNRSQTWRSIVLSTILFVVWHPVGAYLFIPEALPYLTNPRFLVFVAAFGLLFCYLRKLSGSIWAPMGCHWLLTITWKGLGGAQFLTD